VPSDQDAINHPDDPAAKLGVHVCQLQSGLALRSNARRAKLERERKHQQPRGDVEELASGHINLQWCDAVVERDSGSAASGSWLG
jgi:hypothetical protein